MSLTVSRAVCAAICMAMAAVGAPPARADDAVLAAVEVVAAADEAAAAGTVEPGAVTVAAAETETETQTDAKISALHTRFVIGLDRKVDFQVFSLANPNRVVVELPDVKIQLPPSTGDGPVGLVKSFRGGLAAPGKTRIVIDVTQPVVVESSKIEKGKDGQERLAIEIMPLDALKSGARKGLKTAPSGLGASGVQPPLPKRAESPRQRAARAFKPVIVIDPGHGGMDSGAQKRGTIEKNVVLAFSHVLREKLEKSGRYKVMMTRDKDIFVELEERVSYAERNSANLFIAVHADYAGTRAHGATIFSLRDGVAKDLQHGRSGEKLLSANELSIARKASTEADAGAVTGILAELAERDRDLTHQRTNIFAKAVIANMSESTTMRSEPDQQAAFKVLKTAQFPSVLIELGYVSNREDADNLESEEWRSNVADSIYSAIENYFSNQVAHMPM